MHAINDVLHCLWLSWWILSNFYWFKYVNYCYWIIETLWLFTGITCFIETLWLLMMNIINILIIYCYYGTCLQIRTLKYVLLFGYTHTIYDVVFINDLLCTLLWLLYWFVSQFHNIYQWKNDLLYTLLWLNKCINGNDNYLKYFTCI